MDNYLDSFEHPDVAFKLSQEFFTLPILGGFNLTKFISDVPKFNNKINPTQSTPQQRKKRSLVWR